ncbi:heat shock factor binding protein 1 [Usnea florida]
MSSANRDLNSRPSTAMSTGEENDLVKAVDNLLNNLGPKFSKVSAELFAKMDEMSRRLDDMEAAIKAGNNPENGEV